MKINYKSILTLAIMMFFVLSINVLTANTEAKFSLKKIKIMNENDLTQITRKSEQSTSTSISSTSQSESKEDSKVVNSSSSSTSSLNTSTSTSNAVSSSSNTSLKSSEESTSSSSSSTITSSSTTSSSSTSSMDSSELIKRDFKESHHSEADSENPHYMSSVKDFVDKMSEECDEYKPKISHIKLKYIPPRKNHTIKPKKIKIVKPQPKPKKEVPPPAPAPKPVIKPKIMPKKNITQPPKPSFENSLNINYYIRANNYTFQSLSSEFPDLFLVPKIPRCAQDKTRTELVKEVLSEEKCGEMGQVNPILKFRWLKNWGNGPVAYLFDFLDQSFKDDIVSEFIRIYNDTFSFNTTLKCYKDPFDFINRVNLAKDEDRRGLLGIYEEFLKYYNPKIYKKSVNAVQLFQMLKNFNWEISKYTIKSEVKKFIDEFDLNLDGRLNPKELILGSIIYRKQHNFEFYKCSHCFRNASMKLSALFKYLDCDDDGVIEAQDIWDNLQHLNRTNNAIYNIFSKELSKSIRIDSINDFILKNQKSKRAYVTRDEFISGVLLGYWQRHINETHIVNDNTFNNKTFRWSSNGLRDVEETSYTKHLIRGLIVKKRISEVLLKNC